MAMHAMICTVYRNSMEVNSDHFMEIVYVLQSRVNTQCSLNLKQCKLAKPIWFLPRENIP